MRLAVEGTETEDLFATLANESPVGICIIQDGKFCYTNPTFQHNTGYREDELLGRDSLELVVPEDREMARENAIKMLKGELNLPHQFRVMHNDGSIHWVIESVASVQYRGRRAILGNLVDITEHKQTEEALQAERNKLQSVIGAMEDGLTIQDTDYNIIYQNEPLRKNYGDHLDEKCYRVYEGRDKPCAGCPVKKAFKDGKSHTSERSGVLLSGEVAFAEVTANPIRDAGGNIVSCLEIVRNITERKQAEEALQMERNKLQSVIDAMQDDLTIQDKDYNIIYQNEPARISSGGDRVGEKCYRVYEGQEGICEDCPVEKAFKDGKPHTSVRQRVLPSGELSFWETTANPIRDAGGKVVACLEIGRNITERKKQEQAFADELTQRRLLIEKSLDGIVVLDEDARVVEANQRFAEMLGYTLEEVRELHTWDWDKNFPPEQILEMGQNVDEKGLHLETKHTRKDGSVFDVDISISGIMCGGRKLIFCIDRDITERRRMEEALRDSEEKLRKMFESVTDGISVIDLKGSITEVNERAVEMHGFSSKDELLGKSAFELVAPRDHKRITADMKKAIKQGTIRRAEYTLLRADGSEFPGELSTSVLKDASDSVVGHITIVRDITERKRAREERETLLQEITKSNRRLEGANKELQDFVYVASHDLREPLRKISSFGTLLQDSLEGKLDEDQQENFEFMIDGARRMQDMIDDLLTYSRLTTRAKPPQQVFLNEVIENLKKLELATLLDETRGTIHIPEPLPPVQADPSQMNQLFQNLIGNGLKFHQEGIPPEIIIRAHGVDNKMIQIEVEDNGIGIDEKYHEQLFVMFKRLHSRAQYDGTGIGLAICKKIVERHGGNIGVKSTPGKGSIFWFTLPRGSYLKED